MSDPVPARSQVWKWCVCGLLLCASMLMYMDRQTLPSVATRITREFGLNQEQYGNIEMTFGYAFAAGALTFGIMADKWSVRWLYPSLLIAWSAMGFFTGLVETYSGLLICRTLLGFFESGHWPCALKTTQRLLSRDQRTMGNSVLQSGASFGAILTPLVMNWMLAGRPDPGLWRKPFLVIGSLGVIWLIAWFTLLRKSDFAAAAQPSDSAAATASFEAGSSDGEGSFWRVVFSRRFLVLCVIVACINIGWQIIRAWLPKFLQEGRGYSEFDALNFNSLYYLATDVGCLGAGAASLWLVKRSFTVHGSRALVYGCCALLTSLTTVAAFLPRGWALLGMLLVVGAGALGLFPCYYSFTQELSTRHQGKVTGLLGLVAWVSSSYLQKLFGRLVDKTGSFDTGIALAGLLPLVGLVFLWLCWDRPGAAEPNPKPVR
jgi:ACS family hexuronate transporter-like MFS transporter